MLLASIRDGGNSLCPSCICPKGKAPGLGTAADRRLRNRHARAPTEDLRRKIQIARKIIYVDGYAVNSKAVDEILKHGLYVATDVRV